MNFFLIIPSDDNIDFRAIGSSYNQVKLMPWLKAWLIKCFSEFAKYSVTYFYLNQKQAKITTASGSNKLALIDNL